MNPPATVRHIHCGGCGKVLTTYASNWEFVGENTYSIRIYKECPDCYVSTSLTLEVTFPRKLVGEWLKAKLNETTPGVAE